MDSISAFIASVLASVIGYYICKWLDGDKQQQPAHRPGLSGT